ncbi:MAG TPA: RsmB/NOP family class I SAM-dependent RNA methyltransferase [Candidatus Acetothermia bacterium]|nr:RsmB/NOP family class I SAM-dependent RNA methyltransferase [Candidatus Acetothermia bacterium]
MMHDRGAPPSASGLSRYRPIIDDWEAFEAAVQRPLPFVIRTNTLRIDSEALLARLTRQQVMVRRTRWSDELLEVCEPPGRRMEHWLGLYYIQEATQALPVLALDARPGMQVLDMCSAPGGKATHIAACMGNRGLLVANEPNGRRQMSLLANLNRIGVLMAQVTAFRGENFPLSRSFDRVLVDAPCSAEGTARKESSVRLGIAPPVMARLARQQRRLLLRAFDVLAPGGLLVYSTCTLAPEENESVVADLLAQRDARLVAPSLPVTVAPGLTEWNGTRYPPEMTLCRRIYPHHLDSGGGFLACIRRA